MADTSKPEDWGNELPVTKDANPPIDIKFDPTARFTTKPGGKDRMCPDCKDWLPSYVQVCPRCKSANEKALTDRLEEEAKRGNAAAKAREQSKIVGGKCTWCNGPAQESTNNFGGDSRLACPSCSPNSFIPDKGGKTRQGLQTLGEIEVRRREKQGVCENCGVQMFAGECDTHGTNTKLIKPPSFDVSDAYATTGVIKPTSTLEDYKHMAWSKGGTVHFQDEACTTGQCTPDTADHKDRLILHWDARTANQKNPRHREYQELPQLRTHRSAGLFRSTTDASGNSVRMNEQS